MEGVIQLVPADRCLNSVGFASLPNTVDTTWDLSVRYGASGSENGDRIFF